MVKFLRNSLSSLAALSLALMLGGCQSYNDRAWKTVEFVSSPERATVFINGKNCGLTPRQERLSCTHSYDVRFSLPGYFDETCTLEPFMTEDGQWDLLERMEVTLLEITPEMMALREKLDRENAPKTSGAEPAKPAKISAAEEFLALEPPVNFTEFRLREKMLKNLLNRGEITQEEYNDIHEKLYSSYNENRLLKTPRLGTYENGQ